MNRAEGLTFLQW